MEKPMLRKSFRRLEGIYTSNFFKKVKENHGGAHTMNSCS
jgi:hypothetical protein